MSHTVRVQCQVRSEQIVERACRRLLLQNPVFPMQQNQRHAIVHLRPEGWPSANFNLDTGEVALDADYQSYLDPYLQAYGCEAARYAAEQQGLEVSGETVLADGSIELVLASSY